MGVLPFGRQGTGANDRWSVASGHHDGKPLVVRCNTALRTMVGSPTHSIQVGVAVPLLAPDGNGFPEGEEQDQLHAFEDALIATVADRAVLAAVISTGGMREFVLYSGERDWLPALHADLKSLLPDHEVQMMAQTDPAWSVYRFFTETKQSSHA